MNSTIAFSMSSRCVNLPLYAEATLPDIITSHHHLRREEATADRAIANQLRMQGM
jgi:hypothetical protein